MIDGVLPGANMTGGGVSGTPFLHWDSTDALLLGQPRCDITPPVATNNTRIATTAFVRLAIAQYGGLTDGGIDGGTF